MSTEEKKAADKAAADKAAADNSDKGSKADSADSGEAKSEESAKPKSLVEQFQAAKTGKKTKVEFVESPTGALNLAYNIGEKASFTKDQADLLYELGLAKPAK